MMLAAILLVSCGTSRKVAQKPVKTYVQPGHDLLDAPDVLRAWAVGTSDSEMTAKKKAVAAASSELLQALRCRTLSAVHWESQFTVCLWRL